MNNEKTACALENPEHMGRYPEQAPKNPERMGRYPEQAP